ncbi:MAG: hypothetical protein HN368_13265 [Spirochaetales bacterium]|nr:hypothetical protein [Spirochaetales bacterium]
MNELEKSHLSAGVGRCNISPPLGTPLMGYPDPFLQRKAESVRDPLNATALYFERGSYRVALLSLDTTIIDNDLIEAIRRGASEQTGICEEHIVICSIQTHSAPRTQLVWGWGERDAEFCEGILVPGAIEAIVKAHRSPVAVRIGIGAVKSRVGVNRRAVLQDHSIGLGQHLWGAIDPTMTVLRIESKTGTLANVVHYGAHPTVFDGKSRVVSRDWPGIMIDRMESLTGGTTLFVNGAVGDIAPRTNSMSAVGDGETSLWEVGGRAAMDSMAAWRSIKDFRDLELDVSTKTLKLPHRPLPSREEAAQRLDDFEPVKNKPGRNMAEYRYWQAVTEALNEPIRPFREYQQTVAALGPVALVPFPGEPFAETVLRLRAASPFQHTLCASTSCGNHGYFPTRESYNRGGYEAWIGKALGAYLLAENIDDVLYDENLSILTDLHTRVYCWD